MMKKIVILMAVMAIACFSRPAFAVHEGEMRNVVGNTEFSIDGSVDIRSRNFRDLDFNKDAQDSTVDTQERIRLGVNLKNGTTSGRIQLENNWDTFGRLETYQGNSATNTDDNAKDPTRLMIREAWLNFNLPELPVGVKVGHQFLQLGQAWFFRSMKYGSDAWVVYNVTGGNQVAFVDVKVSEGDTARSDDIDAYVLLDVLKINDQHTVGIDVTYLTDRDATVTSGLAGGNPFKQIQLTNVGLNYTGTGLGPVNLKAEADIQSGKASADGILNTTDVKFKGYQVVVQGNVPVDPVTINFTAAMGSGNKIGDTDAKQPVTILDADQHYTFLYEYKIAIPATSYLGGVTGTQLHGGFANTTAVSVGAMFAAAKSLSVGANVWYLKATEKVINGMGEESDKIGTEVDGMINWTLADNLTWNWVLGYFKPGDAMKTSDGTTDPATGIQGVLTAKF
jgi:hypothetical protein